ncbi:MULTISPECIES: acyl-CoA dehydrogenase family protein [Bradyrhizobium]|uniref:acyl-CoA dehydrogenase family protein n=1 Tax=Bradyrhizobium TaxID=374 RepID=UPI00155E5360|nr:MULTISPECIES: acyl-CoA dehydrogenase family protein [Bradyrhizobium]MDD1517794.1 acyl-CoA dehydrogenase [Bradyrhizobium sp. WBAH30]MDD1540861.1 acyl-CoA dehydrogenase [Bradyrhizobium sp. WBAH41]MDD1555695.1 acyl-CoA dehydrogenase [Bradyrhizobium sp. WBAH23]MDD1563496.1 acyl-CoA dehydrogenase [Bradyrhizobium sp. WBAH33]MDD1588003.1 acyl-CoA dehydrogenase [Bradyrhizobium sp. WBAH42]
MAIDFRLSEDQIALRDGARAFAQTALKDVRATIRNYAKPDDRFYAIRPFHKMGVDAGFVKGLFPKEVGGTDVSTLDFALAAEELCVVDVNVPSAMLGTGLCVKPVIMFGTEEQKQRLLPDFIQDGSLLGALAFTEVTGGANFDAPDPRFGVKTFAIREGDEWVINGEKHYTTNGTGWDGKNCHLFAVVCRTDPSKGAQDSLAVIMVPGSTPGVKVTGILDTAGHRATISPRMKFENVRVPAGNIIGKPGDGIEIVSTNFAWTAALIGAACVGVMRAAFDHAVAFARKDARSGPHPIIEYSTVGYMLADMKMKIEACRYLTWKACQQFDLSKGREHELAVMTKVFCSETCVDVVYDAMRLVGVDSYTDMHPLAELMNDAMCFPLYDGGNMGARRRNLHNIIKSPTYSSLTAPYGMFGA